MKECNKCYQLKEESEFSTYWHSTFQKHYTRGYCRECEYAYKNKHRRDMREVMNNKDDYWGATGDDYFKNPNEYTDENQRLSVFRIMKLLKWKFNVQDKIWYKEPLKLRDGTFPNIKQSEKNINRKVSNETISKIKELNSKGMKNWEIAKECGVHSSTVYKYCNADPNYKKTKNKKKNDSIK